MTHSTADSTPFDTSDTDSHSTTPLISSTERADEPPTDLLRSLDKQIALYPQDDMVKADLFQKWWNLTPYGTKLRSLRKNMKWGGKATHKESAWPQFIEGANVMQGEPRVICTLCQKDLAHPSTKRSGTKALWNHLDAKDCKNAAPRPLPLQQLLKSRANKVSFMIYHIDLSHLLTS
jgi:hypothetical protein